MQGKAPRVDTPQKPFLVSIGSILAIGYWILEAYFDSLLIADTTFMLRLFPSDANELWMRSLVSALFVGFGLYAHGTHVRIRAAEKLNAEAGWLLENAISNTIRGRFPICVNCMNIRDEDGHWVAPDRFISAQTEAEFSRTECDRCRTESR